MDTYTCSHTHSHTHTLKLTNTETNTHRHTQTLTCPQTHTYIPNWSKFSCSKLFILPRLMTPVLQLKVEFSLFPDISVKNFIFMVSSIRLSNLWLGQKNDQCVIKIYLKYKVSKTLRRQMFIKLSILEGINKWIM